MKLGSLLKSSLLKKLLLIPVGIVIALVFAEVVIQLIGDPRDADHEKFLKSTLPHYRLAHLGLLAEDPDPRIRFTLRPGFDARIGDDHYRVNQLGLRGGPVPLEKPAGTRRILIVGDSYAFGFGVDEPDTLAARLQDDLRKDHGDVTVLNMGVPGYQTGQELGRLERDGFRLQPDLVILVYYANDNVAASFHYDPERKICYVDELPLPLGFKRFMIRFALYAMATKAYTAHLERSGVLEARNPDHMGVTRSRLAKIADLCRKQNVKLLLVAIPALASSTDLVNEDHIDTRLHRQILAHAQSEGIPAVDFRAELIRVGKPIEELILTDGERVDMHLTGEGYTMLARQIAARIREVALLDG
ncbi:MAG: GDSL-type esterase/lipase family protein [Planctomycetota bacterium]